MSNAYGIPEIEAAMRAGATLKVWDDRTPSWLQPLEGDGRSVRHVLSLVLRTRKVIVEAHDAMQTCRHKGGVIYVLAGYDHKTAAKAMLKAMDDAEATT